MAVTSNDIANEALQIMGGNQPYVSGQNPNWDNGATAQGKALAKLYDPCVATVQRQWGWDASRNAVSLSLSGNPSALPNFAYEYLYPTNGIEIWQLYAPSQNPGNDPNNPIPARWVVGNNLVSAVQTKVIWTNLPSAKAIYNNNPSENTWDALFREAVVRLLASDLSMALAGKPDLSQSFLQSGGAFETLGESRPD